MEASSINVPNIRIALLESDPLRVVGFLSILDRIQGVQMTAMPVSEVVATEGIDIAVIGNRSPRFLETMAQLKTECPKVRVVVTGRDADDETILKAIVYGARGFVDEAAPAADLAQAIHTVHQGSIWGSRRVLSMFIDRSGDLLAGVLLALFLFALEHLERLVLRRVHLHRRADRLRGAGDDEAGAGHRHQFERG